MTPIELKQLRDSKGLTQQAFADALDISIRTYKRWESNKGYKRKWDDEIQYGPSKDGLEAIRDWQSRNTPRHSVKKDANDAK